MFALSRTVYKRRRGSLSSFNSLRISGCLGDPVAFPLLPPLIGRGDLGHRRSPLRLCNYLIDSLGRQATHLHQVVGLDHRKVVVGQKALAHEPFGERIVEPLDRRKSGRCPLDLLVELLLRHDLDVPAAEFAGQPHILPAAADRQRELVFPHKHDPPAEHLAEDDLVDLGRLERVGHEHLEVVAPANNVDPLATEFLNDVFDAIAADAHAGPHAIDATVGADHSHLAAVAGLPGDGPDLDHAVGDLGDLLFEEPLHELRPDPREDDLHPAANLADLEDRSPDSLIGMVALARDLLTPREDRLLGAELDGGGRAFKAGDDAGDHVAHLLLELVVDRVPLGLADLLDDHLLSGLGPDPAGEFGRLDRLVVVGARDRAVFTIDRDDDLGRFPVLPR